MFACKFTSLTTSNRASFLTSPLIQSVRCLNGMTSNGDPEGKKIIAVVQLNCKEDKEENYRMSEKLIREASSYGCSMAFLPENFDVIKAKQKDIKNCLESIDGPIINRYRDLAKSCNIWLSLGSFHEKLKHIDDKGSNTSIVINNSGEIVSTYRKTHLWDVDKPDNLRVVETEFTVPGDRLVPPFETPIGKLGLGICYDVRFPEHAISLTKAGASVITYPSAFTIDLGSALWEPILRARAIENQVYIVAPSQVGPHNSKRYSWGRSMVIDPWGCVIAQVGVNVGLALAIIDPALHLKLKDKLPDGTNRRPDLYGEVLPAK